MTCDRCGSRCHGRLCADCESIEALERAAEFDTVDEDPHAELRDDEDDVVTDGGVWGRNESGYLSAETCPKCGEELQYQGHHGQLQCLSTPSHTFTHLRTGSGTHWLADADGETHAKTTIADEPAPHSGGGSR
ncbi:hypothetical protein QTL95_16085 [Rhizobium sp. S152]|nr:hypothetical protein [Rhizobium sp. S152]MDM9627428.1 hypothetical protein [Rhizobium sp. S152]